MRSTIQTIASPRMSSARCGRTKSPIFMYNRRTTWNDVIAQTTTRGVPTRPHTVVPWQKFHHKVRGNSNYNFCTYFKSASCFRNFDYNVWTKGLTSFCSSSVVSPLSEMRILMSHSKVRVRTFCSDATMRVGRKVLLGTWCRWSPYWPLENCPCVTDRRLYSWLWYA